MSHNDIQTQFTNNFKPSAQSHPIDRMLATYHNVNDQFKQSSINTRLNQNKSDTKRILHRQRAIKSFITKPDETEPTIRKSSTFYVKPESFSISSIASPTSLSIQLNEESTNNNNNRQHINRKQLNRKSPILLRPQLPRIGNHSPTEQRSDITISSTNQSSLILLNRNKSPSKIINNHVLSPRNRLLNHSKTIIESVPKPNSFNEVVVPHNTYRSSHASTLPSNEQNTIHDRTLATILLSKSHLARHLKHLSRRSFNVERTKTNSKQNNTENLRISSQRLPNSQPISDIEQKIRRAKIIVDEWEDPKSSIIGISDEDESVNPYNNSSMSTYKSQLTLEQLYDYMSSTASPVNNSNTTSPSDLSNDIMKTNASQSSSKKSPRRRAYNIALPPLTEDMSDEDKDMKKIVENFDDQSNNEENSLTFQLLNQKETEFERKICKLRKFQFKQ